MTQPITQPTYGTYRWFGRAIGRYLGIGTDWNVWNHQQENDVDEIIERGMMAYYYPPMVDAQTRPHEWSFLRPVGAMTTASGNRIYDLPEDFERFSGPLTYADDNTYYPPIEIVSEQRLRALEYQNDYQNYPFYAAARPKQSDGTIAQRQEVVFHPTPDGSYELKYRYHALPRKLSDDHSYPLGGKTHAEPLLASMLAEAELIRDGIQGPMTARYHKRLVASIAGDLRRAPEFMGYNGDGSTIPHSSARDSVRRVRDFLHSNVTYGGTQWNG